MRPIVEYASPVWHSGQYIQQTKQIERIQKRTCRIILSPAYASYEDALTTGLVGYKRLLKGVSISAIPICCTSSAGSKRYAHGIITSFHSMLLQNALRKVRTNRHGMQL